MLFRSITYRSASVIAYDNSVSGLVADNAQEAIDEIVTTPGIVEHDLQNAYDDGAKIITSDNQPVDISSWESKGALDVAGYGDAEVAFDSRLGSPSDRVSFATTPKTASVARLWAANDVTVNDGDYLQANIAGGAPGYADDYMMAAVSGGIHALSEMPYNMAGLGVQMNDGTDASLTAAVYGHDMLSDSTSYAGFFNGKTQVEGYLVSKATQPYLGGFGGVAGDMYAGVFRADMDGATQATGALGVATGGTNDGVANEMAVTGLYGASVWTGVADGLESVAGIVGETYPGNGVNAIAVYGQSIRPNTQANVGLVGVAEGSSASNVAVVGIVDADPMFVLAGAEDGDYAGYFHDQSMLKPPLQVPAPQQLRL